MKILKGITVYGDVDLTGQIKFNGTAFTPLTLGSTQETAQQGNHGHTFGTAQGTFCQGNDSRLSDSRTPQAHTLVSHTASGLTTGHFLKQTGQTTFAFQQHGLTQSDVGQQASSHQHGNITIQGQIGTTATLPIITTTSGVLTTGSFGTAQGTFCQGNDSRLSDSRTPTSHTHTKSQITDFGTYEQPLTFSTGFTRSTNTITVNLDGDSTKTQGKFYKSTTVPTDTIRINYDGYFYQTRVYNAVYNDYQECFENQSMYNFNYLKNRIVEITENGKIKIQEQESNLVIGVVSDSYGYILNGSEEEIKEDKKIPIQMQGTVNIIKEDVNIKYPIGQFVISGKNGTQRVIENMSINKYFGCIVGKIISNYNNMIKILVMGK